MNHIFLNCPHCRKYGAHCEPIGTETNVRACPDCQRFFYLWWTVKDARMFGVSRIKSGIRLGYPATQQARFATGGFTSDKAWEDEAAKVEFIVTDEDKRRALEFIEQLRKSRFARFT